MRRLSLSLLIVLVAAGAGAQDHAKIQKDFPAEEFIERRARVMEAIGDDAIAIVQGAPAAPGFIVFRQSNEFYYLTGIEVPHSYLLIDGRNRRSLLFLPRRDPRKERGEGRMLSAEDTEEAMAASGVDQVFAIDQPARQLYGFALRPPSPTLYTFMSPAEGRKQSRDENLIGHAQHVSDPWDGRASREGAFVGRLRERYPQFPIADLTPIVDTMRLHKSPRELELIRRASELAGMGMMEAMRSTKPGLYEYQLDAAAYYIYRINGSQGEGYRSITATGTNAYFGHYYRNDAELKEGELILMDHAPDYRYYTSDIARMWPVSGVFTEDQAARGRGVYSGACGFCHGRRLNGAPDDPDMRSTPPLARARFLREWEGRSLATLFEYTRLTMPEDNPTSLTDAEYVDVIAYMLSVSRIPVPATREAASSQPIREKTK